MLPKLKKCTIRVVWIASLFFSEPCSKNFHCICNIQQGVKHQKLCEVLASNYVFWGIHKVCTPKIFEFYIPHPSKQDPFPNLICIIFATHPTLPKKSHYIEVSTWEKVFCWLFFLFSLLPNSHVTALKGSVWSTMFKENINSNHVLYKSHFSKDLPSNFRTLSVKNTYA